MVHKKLKYFKCIKTSTYIPANAYAYGSSWKCHSGYKKSGNSCIKNVYIPPNAYASGSSWKCNSGYTKSGNNCIESQIDNQVYSAASGSGFAVTSDGYVITNYHVIKGCTDVYIHDKGESILSTIVTFDPNNDIALLKGNFKPKSFYPLSRESTKLLTEVYVAGHPFGRDISTAVKVTRGIVSSLTGVANNFSNLQIDASLQPGNSGGPIMNDKGNVIGVAVAKLDLDTIVEDYGVVPENVNFGIKSNVVINIMESENIKLPKPNINSMPMSELSEMITDGTYYLSCWMTMAQINKMRETKVIFKSLN
jgi:S1-C subfamily serine protease